MAFTCLFYSLSAICQNLIKNPSFEIFVKCPERLGNFDVDLQSWSTPTEGSTDYFNSCSTAMGTPKNFNGTQPADFGKGYAGLYLYAPNDYREYLQAELTQPLTPGKMYTVSFYVSLAERSDFAIKEFGVLFSKDKLEIPIKKELSKKQLYKEKDNDYHYMEIGYTNFYSDTQDWILVHTQFTAKGTEKFMIVGNFKSNARTRMFKTKRDAKQGAYYYIDMVALETVKQKSTEYSAMTAQQDDTETFTLDKTHVFKNVLFAFDEFQLLESAKQELQQIFEYLNSDKSLLITINGHTDGVGSDTYNNELSGKRAKAVAAHLEKLGISRDRISSQGHGGTKPVAVNSTEEGRQLNRRVEFLMSRNSSTSPESGASSPNLK